MKPGRSTSRLLLANQLTWLRGRWLSLVALLVTLVLTSHSTGWADPIRLKSGHELEGQPKQLQSLNTKYMPKEGPVPNYPIVMVETGWQRYFVPARQVLGEPKDWTRGLVKDESFTLPQRRQGRQLTVSQVGGLTNVTPFDEFGRRSVTLQTPKGAMPVLQGITKLTPQYVEVEALNCLWQFGLPTSAIPPDTLYAILRKTLRDDEPQDRLAIVRFLLQAGHYAEAQHELATIATAFPSLADKAELTAQEIKLVRGRQLLKDLRQRVDQGQYRLAESVARQVSADDIGPGVAREIGQFLTELSDSRQAVEKVQLLLGEYQAQVPAGPWDASLPAIRSRIAAELSIEALPRLAAFIRAEFDESLSPAEKLALGLSGYAAGDENAVTDLVKAVSYCEARSLATTYLQSQDSEERKAILTQIGQLEGMGINALVQLASWLPPEGAAEAYPAGQLHRITVSDQPGQPPVSYIVLLPPEYNPARSYPLLVALRPSNFSAGKMLEWWGGTAERAGMTQRRGYIAIAPEYAPADEQSYTYGIAPHKIVLESIDDTRRRFAVDSDRIYLTGHGMGADAAFDIGFSHPDRFAGVIPICGEALHYCNYYKDQAYHTPWYVVAGEYDRETMTHNANLFEYLFKYGYRNDLVICEFLQRGSELYPDEQARIFDWMSIHRRAKLPKEFEYQSLRRSDNQFYWLRIDQLPQHVILPQPAGDKSKVTTAKIEGRITEGNTIYITAPGTGHQLLLSPDQLDLDKPVVVKINNRQRSKEFLKPSPEALLEHLRCTGDRQRLVWSILKF